MRPADLGLLRERGFRVLFAAQAVSLLGDGMTSVAIAFAVLEMGGSATDLGFVLSIRAALLVAFLVAGGVFADRLPRRAVMLGADLARFSTQAILAVLLIAGHAQMWQLLVVAGVHGIATAFFNPALSGLLPSVVSVEQLHAANALRGFAIAAGGVLGAAAAGVIVAVAGAGWAVAADAASFGASAACLSRLQLAPHGPRPVQSFTSELRQGFSAVRARAWVWSIIVCVGVGNMMFTWFMVLGPLVAQRSLGGADAWALIMGALATGSCLGGLAATQLRPRRPLLTACAALPLTALSPALLAFGPPVAIVATAALIGGICLVLFNTLWETSLQRQIPTTLLSRVSAYDWLGSAALSPIGFAIAGPIAATIGVDRSLWLAAALIATTSVLPLAVPEVRDLRAATRALPMVSRSRG